MVKTKQSFSLQPELSDKIIIAGLDEVGRGPWAGPIVACAYVETTPVIGVKITDSKKMNEAERETAYEILIKSGAAGIGMVEAAEIDKLGLTKANRLAFRRALENLQITPDLVLIDGNDKVDKASILNIPFRSFIKGDSAIRAISCASIVAKVTRDRLMKRLSKKYPNYRFDEHKGYGTSLHKKLLKQFGVSEIHRHSYKPVQMLLQAALPEDL